MDLQSRMSRRERQIMDIVFARGEVTGAGILGQLPDPCTRGALRVMLRTLEEKGFLRHEKSGRRFVYRPTRPAGQVGPPALRKVLDTFFGGSLRNAVAAHLAQRDTELDDEELAKLAVLIRQARQREKRS